MIIYSMIWWSIIRFRIKSSDSGFIANSYDIASFLCLLPGRHPHHQCRHQHHRDPLHDADMMSQLMSMMLTQSDSSRWSWGWGWLVFAVSYMGGRGCGSKPAWIGIGVSFYYRELRLLSMIFFGIGIGGSWAGCWWFISKLMETFV